MDPQVGLALADGIRSTGAKILVITVGEGAASETTTKIAGGVVNTLKTDITKISTQVFVSRAYDVSTTIGKNNRF